MSIPALNDDVSCDALASDTYCLPEPCQVMRIDEERTSAIGITQNPGKYGDINLVQFMRWNPHADLKNIFYEEVICVG